MSTNDVPGANPDNGDELAMGCWAEHDDGSLLLVESTENDRVIYSMFDLSKKPPVEYRDAMAQKSFEKTFTFVPDKKGKAGKKSGANEKWTWHDKTAFPWDRIIKTGGSDGPRLPSAEHVLTAAERVASSLKLRGSEVDPDRFDRKVGKGIWKRIKKAIERELGV